MLYVARSESARLTRSAALALWIVAAACAGAGESMPLSTPRLYVPVDVPALVEIDPSSLPNGPLDLIAASSPDDASPIILPLPELCQDLRQSMAVQRAPLGSAFWVQARSRGEAWGTPLIVELLAPPSSATDRLKARVWRAFESNDRAGLMNLLALPAPAKESLRSKVDLERAGETDDASTDATLEPALRIFEERFVHLETSAGVLLIALRHDLAPRTAFHVRRLVAEGFYDGLTFHRLVPQDALGRPFLIQTGDPTGTGLGGAGDRLAYEASALRHDVGVLSMARLPDDPNSASSQFFICLGRDACAELDGSYAAFGQVVEGLDVLDALANWPGDPPRIIRATLTPAPPLGHRPRPVSERPAMIDRPVDR